MLPVAPVLQTTEFPHPVAVRVTVCPSQQISLSAVTVGAGGAFFVPITVDALLLPQVVVQVAVYVPAVPTVIVVPFAPVLQLTVPVQPVAVKVAVSPAHIEGLLLDTVGAGGFVPVVMVTTFEVLVPQLLLQLAL